jgi:hypothetical protein
VSASPFLTRRYIREHLARRESLALIRSSRGDFSPAHRPNAPTVENFFVRRAAGRGPIHSVIASCIRVVKIRRQAVLRVPER